MRQYKIKEVDLGFIIYKVKKENWLITILYWNWKWRDWRKECAKTYYFKDDAIWGLIIARKHEWSEPC